MLFEVYFFLLNQWVSFIKYFGQVFDYEPLSDIKFPNASLTTELK